MGLSPQFERFPPERNRFFSTARPADRAGWWQSAEEKRNAAIVELEWQVPAYTCALVTAHKQGVIALQSSVVINGNFTKAVVASIRYFRS